jgi:phytoene dehydrogenase-like protein
MSSNSPLAAFRRPPNRVRGVRGLYLASGSAHPGGGVPLCLLSGRAAAEAVVLDRGAGSSPPLSPNVAEMS